jgi:hypothetical protein
MSSKSKSARGHTFFMVESREAQKALREFRQSQLNQNKNIIKKDDSKIG